MIGYAEVVSVSISYSRCSNFMSSSCSMTHFPYKLHIDSLWLVCIYSVDTILYSYPLPLESILILTSSFCLSATWALWVKIVIFGKALTSSPCKRGVVERIHRWNWAEYLSNETCVDLTMKRNQDKCQKNKQYWGPVGMTKIFTNHRRSLRQLWMIGHRDVNSTKPIPATNKNVQASMPKSIVLDPGWFDSDQTKFED